MIIDETVTDSVYNPRPTSTFSIDLETLSGGSWVKTPFTSSGNGTNPQPSFNRTRRLVRDTEWLSQIAKGGVVIHPYSNRAQKIDYGYHHYESTLNGTLSTTKRVVGKIVSKGPVIHNGIAAIPSIPTSPTDLKNMLITEAVAESKTGALQAMVTLMESPKTFFIFGETVAKLSGLINTARKRLAGDKREVMKLLDRIEVHGVNDGVSMYLQYRYGWRILLLEIEAAFKALSEMEEYYGDVLRRSRAVDELGGSISGSVSGSTTRTTAMYTDPQQYALVLGWRRETRTTLIRGSALAFYKMDEQAHRARALSISLLPTLWELKAYSFVYDWFTNVGEWLRAYAQALPGMSYHGGVYSSLVKNETTFSVSEVYYGSRKFAMVATQPTVSARLTGYEFNRSLFNPAAPVVPVVYNELNLMRCIDAVALVTQRFNALSRDAASWRFKLPRK